MSKKHMKSYSTSGKDKLRPQCVILTCSLVGQHLKTLVWLITGRDVAAWESHLSLPQSFWEIVLIFLIKLRIHMPETKKFSPRYIHIPANVHQNT